MIPKLEFTVSLTYKYRRHRYGFQLGIHCGQGTTTSWEPHHWLQAQPSSWSITPLDPPCFAIVATKIPLAQLHIDIMKQLISPKLSLIKHSPGVSLVKLSVMITGSSTTRRFVTLSDKWNLINVWKTVQTDQNFMVITDRGCQEEVSFLQTMRIISLAKFENESRHCP